MQVEPVEADLSGDWGGVIITSANAPAAIAGNPAREALLALPLLAVGQRSAEAARAAGFTEVTSAGGDVRDLLRALATRRLDKVAPLLYLAGEDRTHRSRPPSLPRTASRPRCAWSTAPSPCRSRPN